MIQAKMWEKRFVQTVRLFQLELIPCKYLTNKKSSPEFFFEIFTRKKLA